MTKLALTEEEALSTAEHYQQLFKDGKSPYDDVDFKLSEDKKYYIIYNKSSGKVLKNKNYTKANFSCML